MVHPKSEDSIGDVEIDPELLEVFREYHAKAKGCFVIEPKRVFFSDLMRFPRQIRKEDASTPRLMAMR